jgi:DNA-binding transcriptional MerR regulator
MQEPTEKSAKPALPPIPAKRYFTIGEVSDLCGVKPHVLRYWEQEFTQLKPVKRRGNRRYYQHHEVLLIRRIRDLLYEQGFTINGARNRLEELGNNQHEEASIAPEPVVMPFIPPTVNLSATAAIAPDFDFGGLRQELQDVVDLLQTAAAL